MGDRFAGLQVFPEAEVTTVKIISRSAAVSGSLKRSASWWNFVVSYSWREELTSISSYGRNRYAASWNHAGDWTKSLMNWSMDSRSFEQAEPTP
jgi:hypothetical protein